MKVTEEEFQAMQVRIYDTVPLPITETQVPSEAI